MNAKDANTFVNNLNEAAMNDIVKRQYFVLIFMDKDGELYGYDTKTVANCLHQVLAKNPDFEFVHAIAETTEAAVRDFRTKLAQVRDIRQRLGIAQKRNKPTLLRSVPTAVPTTPRAFGAASAASLPSEPTSTPAFLREYLPTTCSSPGSSGSAQPTGQLALGLSSSQESPSKTPHSD